MLSWIWSLMANLRWWQVERIDPLKLTFERSTMEKWQHQCYVGWRKLLPQNWAGCKSDGQVILRSLRPPNRLTMNPLSTISSLAGLLFIAGILKCFVCSYPSIYEVFSYGSSSTLNPCQSLGWWVGGQSFETSVAFWLVSLFISASKQPPTHITAKNFAFTGKDTQLHCPSLQILCLPNFLLRGVSTNLEVELLKCLWPLSNLWSTISSSWKGPSAILPSYAFMIPGFKHSLTNLLVLYSVTPLARSPCGWKWWVAGDCFPQGNSIPLFSTELCIL